MTSANTGTPELPAARGSRPPNRGIPPPREAARLRRGLGRALAAERTARGWSVADLALASGASARMIEFLEAGQRRPSVGMLYRLARPLRAGRDERAVAALAERLIDLAGESVRDYSRRPHRHRDLVAARVRAERGEASPPSSADDFGQLVVAYLSAMRSG